MEYIKSEDYTYIINKYHDTAKPFDSFQRFIRRDEIFDEATGMDADAILNGILKQDAGLTHLTHAERKAYAFAYVMEHTRISCDSRDIFPAIHMIDRPLNKTLIKEWKREVFERIVPETEAQRRKLEQSGLVTIWPDFDHSVPVWERIFELGFAGLAKDSEKAREHLLQKRPLTIDEEGFFAGIRITYGAIVKLIGRLQALATATSGSERMTEALQHIQYNPPADFYEALLVNYIYFMLSEHIEGLQVRSLSNFDRIFYPYYRSSLAHGITEEDIRKDLAYFFLQFTAIGNYWNQPVFLGGCKEDESTEINELSYLFLDVYDKMKIYNPKIQIKVADSMPKSFLLKALDMIRRGNNCIVFVTDAVIRKALEHRGATKEQARLCNVKGCYEYSTQGAMDCGMNYFNLLKPLEYAMHEGCDGITGEFMGLASPPLDSFANFESFYEEYKRQLCHGMDMMMKVVNGFEDYLAYINPQSMLSATYPTCLEMAKDALCGGAVSNESSMLGGFIGDVADSLSVIRKYVFVRKEISFTALKDMLDRNFEGSEKFRRKIMADKEKYGNNQDTPDFFAKDITAFIAAYLWGKPNAPKRGGTWNCGFHVARMSYNDAGRTLASPNGRLLGEELSKNCSASMGQNRAGATAAILSVTKIDATAFAGDACLDLGLLPSAVKGEDGLEAMYGLLKTFADRGGHAMHINVFDADTLRDAQKHPEKYQDLQIRVCGWNVLWNHINKKEQDGFIKQAESLV